MSDRGFAGGSGGRVTIRRAYITSGNVTLADTSGAWAVVPGFELQLPAAIGDSVELQAAFMYQPNASFLDFVVVTGVGPTLARYASTGGGTPAVEGDPELYNTPGTYRTSSGPFSFAVQAGDLDSGNVRFAIATMRSGGTGGVLYAGTAAGYPFRWRAINFGAVS